MRALDLIHAHYVFAGKMCLEMGFPFVYNSYEYWSQGMPLKLERRGLQILALKHLSEARRTEVVVKMAKRNTFHFKSRLNVVRNERAF